MRTIIFKISDAIVWGFSSSILLQYQTKRKWRNDNRKRQNSVQNTKIKTNDRDNSYTLHTFSPYGNSIENKGRKIDRYVLPFLHILRISINVQKWLNSIDISSFTQRKKCLFCKSGCQFEYWNFCWLVILVAAVEFQWNFHWKQFLFWYLRFTVPMKYSTTSLSI